MINMRYILLNIFYLLALLWILQLFFYPGFFQFYNLVPNLFDEDAYDVLIYWIMPRVIYLGIISLVLYKYLNEAKVHRYISDTIIYSSFLLSLIVIITGLFIHSTSAFNYILFSIWIILVGVYTFYRSNVNFSKTVMLGFCVLALSILIIGINISYYEMSHFSNKIFESKTEYYYYLDENNDYKQLSNFKVTEAIFYHNDDIFVSDNSYLFTVKNPRFDENGTIIEYYFGDLEINFSKLKLVSDNYSGDNTKRIYADDKQTYILDDQNAIVKILE